MSEARNRPDRRELDATPPAWRKWSTFRDGDWIAFERPVDARSLVELRADVDDGLEYRRPRGSQATPGHHLGRGTKWIKPGSAK